MYVDYRCHGHVIEDPRRLDKDSLHRLSLFCDRQPVRCHRATGSGAVHGKLGSFWLTASLPAVDGRARRQNGTKPWARMRFHLLSLSSGAFA